MIFFLYGDDTFRSREKLKELKAKFIRDVNPSALDVVTFDGATMTMDAFRNAASALTMFTKRRFIVVERLLAEGASAVHEAMLAYCAAAEFPSDHIVVFWEPASIQKSTKGRSKKRKVKKPSRTTKRSGDATTALRDFFLTQKYVQAFPALDPRDVEQWIVSRVHVRGGTVGRSAAQALAVSLGNDLWRASHEIEKLLAHAPGRTITTDDVRAVVVSKTESAIFAFVDAVAAGKTYEALTLFEAEQRAGSAPLYLLFMIVRQFRILLAIDAAVESGVPEQRLATTLRLHPFVIQRARTQGARFSRSALRSIFARLLALDIALKTSSVDARALVTSFVLQISGASRGATSSVRQYSSS